MTRNSAPLKIIGRVAALMAVTLLVMAQNTTLWAKTSTGTPLVICTALGSQTIYIDENGKETSNSPTLPSTVQSKHCSICHLSHAHIIAPAPSQTIAPKITFTFAPANTEYKDHIFVSLRNDSHAIRAPPALI